MTRTPRAHRAQSTGPSPAWAPASSPFNRSPCTSQGFSHRSAACTEPRGRGCPEEGWGWQDRDQQGSGEESREQLRSTAGPPLHSTRLCACSPLYSPQLRPHFSPPPRPPLGSSLLPCEHVWAHTSRVRCSKLLTLANSPNAGHQPLSQLLFSSPHAGERTEVQRP